MNGYPDLLVLGAGPCGLATAHHAQASGLQVQLVDAGSTAGGRMRTTHEILDGQSLIVEHGPVGWAGPTPETDAACQALAVPTIESDAADSHRYLVNQRQLVPLPQSISGLTSSNLLSMRERLRAATEKWADFAPDGTEETVEEFFTRRFGTSFSRKIAGPIVRGLFAGDPKVTSMRALFPQVADAELHYGSVTKAARQHPEIFGGKVTSCPGGVSQLAEALATPLAEHTIYNCSVDAAIKEQGWWFLFRDGKQVAVGRQLAVCLPIHQLGYVLREYLPRGNDSIARFQGQDLATVAVLHRADRIPDPCAGFGVLAPIDHPSPVLGVQFAHSIFPQHVPDGWVLLRGMLGGDADPLVLQRSDAELVDLLSADLETWVGAPRQPERSWVYRIPGGVPRYGLGHAKEAQALFDDLEKVSGLYLGSDALFGIGIEAALARGSSIARAAKEELLTYSTEQAVPGSL
ncbi:MAG: protoporphyrinogen oxidase [Planctomycetes bacterium]|nr:protoporphyrinogen oxidase [Planctomycetota bacterium]